MTPDEFARLVEHLCTLPRETEWVEFKHNKVDPNQIGQYISALSNSAALHRRDRAFIIWGIEDGTHAVVGTTFLARQAKVGNEELENWLLRLLSPRVDFRIHEGRVNGKHVVLVEIPRASHQPVRFSGAEYIRVGTYKKKLKDFPEKERSLWATFSETSFEIGIAVPAVTSDAVLRLIAGLMRRMNICEERGSGIKKVIAAVEQYGLPAPDFRTTPQHTVVVLLAARAFADMDRQERIRACYQHTCLWYVSGKRMTNSSLRQRLKIERDSYQLATRIIRYTVAAGLIRLAGGSRKDASYVPFWA